jgi:hypothetical protein
MSARLALLSLPIVVASLAMSSRAAAATPDARGTFTVATWDAGVQTLDGVGIHVHVYYPMGASGALPILGVVHGASRTAANMVEMSSTFASRGFVVLAPDMPCAFTGCDHAANARQLRAMLAWGVAQSADSTSMLAGKVDGSRRGLVGHSWGGLGSFLATDGDADIDTVVVLDANDDTGVGAAAAPMVTQPSAHLMAEVPGQCNGTSWKTTVYPFTPAPHFRVVVKGAAHCDVEDPSDSLCPLVCGTGNPALAPYFRRYAVAWMSCVLQGDTSMASWLGGSDFDADVTAAHLTFTDFAGLSALPCFGGTLPDGGAVDSGTPSGDAGASNDASIPTGDASSPDSSSTNGADASGATSSGGCSCIAVGASRPSRDDGAAFFALALCASAVGARRRRGHDLR